MEENRENKNATGATNLTIRPTGLKKKESASSKESSSEDWGWLHASIVFTLLIVLSVCGNIYRTRLYNAGKIQEYDYSEYGVTPNDMYGILCVILLYFYFFVKIEK